MQKCSFAPIKIWNKQIKLVCHASTSNKHTNMPYRGKWENQDVSCFHARVYIYTYRYAYEHMEIYIHAHVYRCERVSVYIFRCTQTFSVPWAMSELLVAMPEGSGEFQRQEEPSRVLHGRAGCWRRTWQRGERGAAAAGDRSRKLQQELCELLTRHSWLGREKWKSAFFFFFFPKVEATREGANWNTGKSELTTKSKSFSVVEWKDRETHSRGHTERMMGLARCGRKMVLPGMVYMSQTRIIEVLQCRKDEADELMLVEITVLLPIFPSSLISFH